MLDNVLKKIFVETFAISPDQYCDTLAPDEVQKWDSLGHVQLVMTLQGEFGIEFDVDEMMEMENVGKIKEILLKHGVKP
jgi:acyl carrier protein